MALNPNLLPSQVDTSSFTPEQKALFQKAASLPLTQEQLTERNARQGISQFNTGAAISGTSLRNEPAVTVPTYSTPATPSTAPPVIGFGVQQKKDEQASTLAELQSLFDTQGQSTARQQQLEGQYGVPEAASRLNELYAIDAGYQADLSSIASQNLQGTLEQQGTPTGEAGRQINLKDLNYNTVIAQQNTNIKRATNSALIAATQGQIANAQNYIQRALDIEFKPLESKINYLEKVLDMNRDSLTKAEQAQLQYKIDQQKEQKATAEQNKKDILSVAVEAAKNGADVQTLQAIQNAKTPQEALTAARQFMSAPSTPDLQFISGTANQPSGVFDKKTGKFTQTGGGGGTSTGEPTSYKSELAKTGIEAVNGLLTIAKASPGIFGKTAAIPVPDFLRSDAFRNYKAQLDYLKGNIIPSALTAMREASKTGGALGQVSDREGAWLASSLGALDMSQDPETVKKQLLLINAHLTNWQNAVNASNTGKNLVTAPDGSLIEITD